MDSLFFFNHSTKAQHKRTTRYLKIHHMIGYRLVSEQLDNKIQIYQYVIFVEHVAGSS